MNPEATSPKVRFWVITRPHREIELAGKLLVTFVGDAGDVLVRVRQLVPEADIRPRRVNVADVRATGQNSSCVCVLLNKLGPAFPVVPGNCLATRHAS